MDNYFLVIRHLFNQSLIELNNRLMFNFWSFMALVIVLSFSGSVFSTLVVLEKYHVNSIEQLLKNNYTYRDIFIMHNGWVWWQFESHKNWKMQLILGMDKMIPRLQTINVSWMINIVNHKWLFYYLSKGTQIDYEKLNQILKNGDGVFLCDVNSAYWRKYLNPGIDYVIGDEKYGYSLSGKLTRYFWDRKLFWNHLKNSH